MAAAGHTLRGARSWWSSSPSLRDAVDDLDRARLLLRAGDVALVVDTDVDVLARSTEALRARADRAADAAARTAAQHARAGLTAVGRDDEAVAAGPTRRSRSARSCALPDVIADATTTLARIDERAGDPEASAAPLLEIVAEARAAATSPPSCAACTTSAACSTSTVGSRRPGGPTGRDATGRVELGRPWAPYGLDARLHGSASRPTSTATGTTRCASLDVATTSPPPPAEAALAVGGPAGRAPAAVQSRCSTCCPACASSWDTRRPDR